VGEGALARSKKNLGLRGTVVFVDETGFSEHPPLRRTWAPRGETPVVTVRGRSWKRMSAIGGLAYRPCRKAPRVFLTLHDDATRTCHILRFLSHLRRHLKGRVVIVWDGLNSHRAAAVRDRLADYGWHAERLPAYAPELNPVEGEWSWVKGGELANRSEAQLGAVAGAVRGAVRKLRRLPATLGGFLAKAGLSF
jgi:transposase